MSFLNTELENQISARFKKLLADDIYQKNKETNEWERVGSGGEGEGGVTLPYWVTEGSVNFDNSVNNAVLSLEGLQINNESSSTGSLLTDKTLTFGDSSGNYELNKNSIETVNKIRDIIGDNVAPDKMLLYDPISKDFGYKNQLVLPGYLEAAGVRFIEGNVTQKSSGTGSTYYNSASKKWVRVNSGLVTIGNALNDTYPDGNKRSIDIRDSGITFNETLGQASSINYERAQTLTRLHAAQDGEPTSEGKMIIFEPSTETYKKASIPTGSTVLPNYIKPENIEFSTGDRHNRLDYRGMNIYRDTSMDKVEVGYDSMTVCRSNDGISTDTTKAFTTIMRNSITLAENGTNFTNLTYSRAKTLENLHNATNAVPSSNAKMIVKELDGSFKTSDLPTSNSTTYYFRVPDYTGIFDHPTYTRNSWFPRLDRTTASGENGYNAALGSHDGPISNPVRNFNINVGDSLILDFTKTFGGQPDDASAFFDTWYVMNISSTTGTKKIIEATLLNSEMTSDPFPEFVDIKTSTSSEVRFRFNGFTTEGSTARVLKKTFKDAFRGKLKLTLLSNDYDTLPTPTVNYS